ncbi:GNAT family N-acetyltransferase [Thermococcus sp.]|uniref:GNAT family N-acetyltransferase n=1 Tax=Thermococcus sp. TaxID=35749 RepID=UPI002607D1E1|nr:GNAT family N-acetyltransferase [Thermococcus sp.]
MRIERVERPGELRDELLALAFRVYRGTGGRYPALEWVEKKPSPDDFEGFAGVYGPFLDFRLREEFDELYVARESEIVGSVALVYTFRGNPWWVPEEIDRERSGLVEFLMVDPAYSGRGIGSALLEKAVSRLRELGREVYVITFPWLEAYRYYLRRGFRKVMDYKQFAVLKLGEG